jgi:membrane protease YdiL (CAAX protease family)
MYQPKKLKINLNSLSLNQELLISLGVALLCLFLSLFFPSQNSAQLITKNIFFLILLPTIYARIILKMKLPELGLNLKNRHAGLVWSSILALFLLLTFYLLLNYTSFRTNYKLSPEIMANFWFFLGYELLLVNFIVFINEFFFRGFIISLFRERLTHWTIALQALIYFLALWLTNSFSWQILPFILFSVSGGILAYKTKSFLYSYFMHFFVIIILDSVLIYLAR